MENGWQESGIKTGIFYNLLPSEERQDKGVLNIFPEAIVCSKRNINIIDSDSGWKKTIALNIMAECNACFFLE